MLSYLAKKSEKRIFFSYLHRFEITQENLTGQVTRQILSVIHQQANQTAKNFNESVSVVSGNIISAAAWGSIYCYLGSEKMLRMEPEYRDIVNEVEWELMTACDGKSDRRTIYCEIFSILYANGLCHPEVSRLLQACLDPAPDLLKIQSDSNQSLV